MSVGRNGVVVALSTILVSAVATARAQPSNAAAAEALFQEGERLIFAGKIDEACEKYAASQELDPTVGTLLYLGDCYERAGRDASAWAAFRKAAYGAAAEGDHRREAIASTRALALEGRLARVALVVDARHPRGLVVRIGELTVPEGSWGTPLPSDPGRQVVVAAAPGRRPWATIVDVPRSGLVRVPVPNLEAEPRGHERAPSRRDWVWISAGTGTAALIVGAAFGLTARDRDQDSMSECLSGDMTRCSDRGVELRREARGYAAASTAAFLAAGAFGAAALVLELTRPSATSERARRSALRLGMHERGATLDLSGAF